EAYIGEGALWNAGIFAWRPSALLEAARESPLAPLTAALAAGDAERGFPEVPAESIDTAVLERADDVFVVPADVQWDDLGSWDALYRLLEGENAVAGEATTIDATGNVIATDDETHVSLIGAEDLVVAAFEDRVLVIPREEAQRVRELVTILEDENRF
ncbi:MAG: mannose-1-phosphate guanylyltransferase, partial [Halodesulfurarchaeum sp.]